MPTPALSHGPCALLWSCVDVLIAGDDDLGGDGPHHYHRHLNQNLMKKI